MTSETADKEPDVHEHGPDRGMRDRVEPLKSEQRVRLEQGNSQRAVLDEALGDPTRAREGRQQERVDPHQESAGKPGEGAGLGGALPVDAADDRRHELHRRRERNEPDRHQRIGLADQANIGITEQHHENNRDAADHQQDACEVPALRQMQAADAQKQRHDEVVADHGRECNRLDDDHAGGGRKAPDEDDQREYGLLFLHRYREHEGVGIDASAREQQQPGERDGQHEYVDEQEVQREQPHRFPEVALVDVLHYQHLELSRQNDDGTHGKQRQRDPTGVTCDAVDCEKSAQRAGGFCLRENLAESTIETERHEQADSQNADDVIAGVDVQHFAGDAARDPTAGRPPCRRLPPSSRCAAAARYIRST